MFTEYTESKIMRALHFYFIIALTYSYRDFVIPFICCKFHYFVKKNIKFSNYFHRNIINMMSLYSNANRIVLGGIITIMNF